jgi:hypothetical protein
MQIMLTDLLQQKYQESNEVDKARTSDLKGETNYLSIFGFT